MSASLLGGGLFSISWKCSVQRIFFSFSVVSRFRCFSLTSMFVVIWHLALRYDADHSLSRYVRLDVTLTTLSVICMHIVFFCNDIAMYMLII